ncbi:DnaJ-domain-containing protein [Saccharata proteae CBS 121410]|uniref:DnaJ-domain-containing protein n=1 Tax=Saccharata proteae CBS 121410 TaxID=1314787 RepID=A0A9P4HQZ8_9PEZI|nr:DnaJ-domain-containing protein [Saccharata proteae CBS 121410]
MGAGQSSASGGASAQQPAAAEAKTSYYELLGVGRQATDDEIKKAYRRKALELHPDRNYGDVERATSLFAEIQSAYEVLSDPQERAWYDSHESAILSGADPSDEHFEHNIKVTTADDITRMMRKFNGRVDFSDSPTGFFGFLRDTFDTLAREEDAAASWEGLDSIYYPSFGHKDDSYDDVVKAFYAVWGGFSTKKTFGWKDIYRLSEAPDRRTRRWMEKENSRLREEGVREFNSAVATLVAFVRKRDPRYTPNTMSEADRQKQMREAAAAQAARARAANEAKMQEEVPEWTKIRDPEEIEESEEEEIEEEVFECVACHKTFKSEKQWDAHEKSKKHQKAVKELQKKMRKENKNLHLDEDLPTPESEEDELEEHFPEAKPVEVTTDEIAGDVEDLHLAEDDDADDGSESQTAHHVKDNQSEPDMSKPSTSPTELESDSEDSDYVPREKLESRIAGAPSSGTQASSKQTSDTEDTPPTTAATPKMGKAAQKRAKRAAQQAEAELSESKFQCAVCNTPFPSKTQLFAHIKKEDHAAPVPQKSGGAKKKKGKK